MTYELRLSTRIGSDAICTNPFGPPPPFDRWQRYDISRIRFLVLVHTLQNVCVGIYMHEPTDEQTSA